MSYKLDQKIENTGTRFKLFAQARYLTDFKVPEVVTISVPRGEVRPGPADNRMFVIDAINKQIYNGYTLPPYQGPHHPPVEPDKNGNFDYLDVDSREFSCASMYATVRRTLDIWEDYFGHTIPWFFRLDLSRLELIPLVEWDNAHSGYGFLEFGYGRTEEGAIDHLAPYCENFDVLAHELGHNILFSQTGVPKNTATRTIDYGGFQESGADLCAVVASLHFNSVIDHALRKSHGDLFTVNELSRLGELPDGREIRVAFNCEKMSTVSEEPHERSLPLTGALFDILVDRFQAELVDQGLISGDLAKRSNYGEATAADLPRIQEEFDAAYNGKEAKFKTALLTARDYFGELLARIWGTIPADNLSYFDVGLAALDADWGISGGRYEEQIRSCFAWREISLDQRAYLNTLSHRCVDSFKGRYGPGSDKAALHSA